MGAMKSEETGVFVHKQTSFALFLLGSYEESHRHSTTHLVFTAQSQSALRPTFYATHFPHVDFLNTHSKVYLIGMFINPEFLFSRSAAPGITFQMKEMERTFLLLFPTESPST